MKSSIEFLFEKRDLKEELKKLNFNRIFTYIVLFLSFIFLNCFSTIITFPNILFGCAWSLFLILFIYITKRKVLIYSLIYLLIIFLHIVQYFHIIILDIPFSFSEIFYSSEGLNYMDFIFSKINHQFLFLILTFIFIWVINCFFIKKYLSSKKNNFFVFLILLICFVFFRSEAILFLGEKSKDNSYYVSEDFKNIYESFSDKEKAYYICGFYEYHIRDLYLLIKNNYLNLSEEEKDKIEQYFKDNKVEDDQYTSLFKNKNLIVVLAESIDNWLITEDIMPTVYNMKENSIDFVNRYAPFYGGGRTLNTEYALNTGLYIPENYIIHNALNNYYGNSLSNIFNSYGYITTSIHFNRGKFYNRDNLHRAYGYSNSYFLKDLYNKEYINDFDVIDNDEIYNLMVSKDEKFMTFFITYSAHVPYNDNNELCSDIKDIDSVSCIKKLAGYTDDAIKLLLEKLQRDNLLDQTVIVFVSDHYAYGIDKNILGNIKGGTTVEYLEKVPFFIWSNDINSQKIDKYVDTQDILPTILNLFGMKVNSNYLGTNILGNNHKNFVYFNDGSYVGEVNKETIENMIEINDLIVKRNYH